MSPDFLPVEIIREQTARTKVSINAFAIAAWRGSRGGTETMAWLDLFRWRDSTPEFSAISDVVCQRDQLIADEGCEEKVVAPDDRRGYSRRCENFPEQVRFWPKLNWWMRLVSDTGRVWA